MKPENTKKEMVTVVCPLSWILSETIVSTKLPMKYLNPPKIVDLHFYNLFSAVSPSNLNFLILFHCPIFFNSALKP